MLSRSQRRKIRQQRRNKLCFHLYEVEYFIRREYPGCPEFAVVRFAHQVCTEPKNWRGVSLEDAVDHVMQNTLRHELTDYDQLLLVGVRRKDARLRVKPKIDAMILAWRR